LEFARWTKIGVIIALCSLLVYELYWVFSIFGFIYRRFSLNLSIGFQRFYFDIFPGATGDVLRVIGVCLFLFAVYLLWGPKPREFASVKKYFAVGILFEAVFWLVALPITVITLFSASAYSFLPLAYVVQILVVSSLLIFLSLKVWHYQKSNNYDILKWGGLSAIGYLTGIWIINVFRWFGMAQSAGLGFLFSGITSLGFLNSIITLSFALIFAVSGFYFGIRTGNRKLAIRFSALALIMLSLFFFIFILYTAFTNSWNFLLVTEIWPMGLLILGLGMLRGEI